MTAQRIGTYNVVCDGPSGRDSCPENASYMDAATAAEIRDVLARTGWAVGLPGGIDRCPKCRQATP